MKKMVIATGRREQRKEDNSNLLMVKIFVSSDVFFDKVSSVIVEPKVCIFLII
jgi:hypothetical protein